MTPVLWLNVLQKHLRCADLTNTTANRQTSWLRKNSHIISSAIECQELFRGRGGLRAVRIWSLFKLDIVHLQAGCVRVTGFLEISRFNLQSYSNNRRVLTLLAALSPLRFVTPYWASTAAISGARPFPGLPHSRKSRRLVKFSDKSAPSPSTAFSLESS